MIVRVSTFKAKPMSDVDELHAARDEGIYALKRAKGLRFRHFFGFKDAAGDQWGGSITIWDDDASNEQYESDGDNKLKGHWNDQEFKDQRPSGTAPSVYTFSIH
jgi:hypothetical protein